uniref:Uncharacterized protein n=1 Tax=Chromera velia CCMP2878 TaxID=1169474 RepID=A0A0G4HB54_9ALVE|eukprot:Cvel_25906.t1-p1 / transcript=Cvel_25906.t1 / gene=Cvel_25906 / organism=Chromera_velia_CCMP2878 / gene_product=hypothetical protein / transcript_product=hypothetical protein / location=Cvel_scaffold2993:13635-16659(+) / protein_length=848 / sequence_SO=supercontig / SO=protein_coding / is_pseudo=false
MLLPPSERPGDSLKDLRGEVSPPVRGGDQQVVYRQERESLGRDRFGVLDPGGEGGRGGVHFAMQHRNFDGTTMDREGRVQQNIHDEKVLVGPGGLHAGSVSSFRLLPSPPAHPRLISRNERKGEVVDIPVDLSEALAERGVRQSKPGYSAVEIDREESDDLQGRRTPDGGPGPFSPSYSYAHLPDPPAGEVISRLPEPRQSRREGGEKGESAETEFRGDGGRQSCYDMRPAQREDRGGLRRSNEDRRQRDQHRSHREREREREVRDEESEWDTDKQEYRREWTLPRRQESDLKDARGDPTGRPRRPHVSIDGTPDTDRQRVEEDEDVHPGRLRETDTRERISATNYKDHNRRPSSPLSEATSQDGDRTTVSPGRRRGRDSVSIDPADMPNPPSEVGGHRRSSLPPQPPASSSAHRRDGHRSSIASGIPSLALPSGDGTSSDRRGRGREKGRRHSSTQSAHESASDLPPRRASSRFSDSSSPDRKGGKKEKDKKKSDREKEKDANLPHADDTTVIPPPVRPTTTHVTLPAAAPLRLHPAVPVPLAGPSLALSPVLSVDAPPVITATSTASHRGPEPVSPPDPDLSQEPGDGASLRGLPFPPRFLHGGRQCSSLGQELPEAGASAGIHAEGESPFQFPTTETVTDQQGIPPPPDAPTLPRGPPDPHRGAATAVSVPQRETHTEGQAKPPLPPLVERLIEARGDARPVPPRKENTRDPTEEKEQENAEERAGDLPESIKKGSHQTETLEVSLMRTQAVLPQESPPPVFGNFERRFRVPRNHSKKTADGEQKENGGKTAGAVEARPLSPVPSPMAIFDILPTVHGKRVGCLSEELMCFLQILALPWLLQKHL